RNRRGLRLRTARGGCESEHRGEKEAPCEHRLLRNVLECYQSLESASAVIVPPCALVRLTSEVDRKMSCANRLCHALHGIRSAARANTFHRQEIVSENEGTNRRDETDPEAGRDIPQGTDEESDVERSGTERAKSARQSKSDAQRPSSDRELGE